MYSPTHRLPAPTSLAIGHPIGLTSGVIFSSGAIPPGYPLPYPGGHSPGHLPLHPPGPLTELLPGTSSEQQQQQQQQNPAAPLSEGPGGHQAHNLPGHPTGHVGESPGPFSGNPNYSTVISRSGPQAHEVVS